MTAVIWNKQKAWFFRHGLYFRYDVVGDYADADYPHRIAGNWPEGKGGERTPADFQRALITGAKLPPSFESALTKASFAPIAKPIASRVINTSATT